MRVCPTAPGFQKSMPFAQAVSVQGSAIPIPQTVDSLRLSQEYKDAKMAEHRAKVDELVENENKDEEIDLEKYPYGIDCWIRIPNCKIMHVLPDGTNPNEFTWAKAEWNPGINVPETLVAFEPPEEFLLAEKLRNSESELLDSTKQTNLSDVYLSDCNGNLHVEIRYGGQVNTADIAVPFA